jgi:hypothetical protein
MFPVVCFQGLMPKLLHAEFTQMINNSSNRRGIGHGKCQSDSLIFGWKT